MRFGKIWEPIYIYTITNLVLQSPSPISFSIINLVRSPPRLDTPIFSQGKVISFHKSGEDMNTEEEQVQEEYIAETMDTESSDEDSDFFSKTIDLLRMTSTSMLITAQHLSNRKKSVLSRRPITAKGYQYIHAELDDHPEEFREQYRMYPDVFRKLCAIMREKTNVQDTRYICVEEMLGMFLLTVGQDSRYIQTRKTFSRSKWTASSNFNKILTALTKLGVEFMVKPDQSVQSKIRESTRFYPYFKDCISAIDGTHIDAMVIGGDKSSYRYRKGTISQNVLAACNFDLEFIYVLSGWEGSAHDSRILTDALRRRDGLKVPDGKYFLADGGFPNRRQFLAPFRGVRYHLKDFGGEGHHPTNEKELFNLRHSSLRNTIERLFGLFKSRFAIFKHAPPFPFDSQSKLVLACAGLHNFLRKECRSDEFPPENIPQSDDDEDCDDDDELGEHGFQTQERQRQNAIVWRLKIANNMWNSRNL